MSKVTLDKMLEDCMEASTASNTPFNSWEINFIRSANAEYQLTRELSENQVKKLEEIWDKI